MKKNHLIFFIIMLSACSSYQRKITDQRLYEKVQSASGSHTVSALTDQDFDKILTYISQGSAPWLELYPEFKEKTFQGITSFQEGLDVSMAYALSINPVSTLKFITKKNVDIICSFPFIEPTRQEIYTYYNNTRTTLLPLSKENHLAERCLHTLNLNIKQIIQTSTE
ncbi:hypothetical protein [Erwinia sp. E_sp_B04_7]|uniref:hypothetical protein n=1 Tax=unclassified Erwinia TaxID=2622719 RepID=UPI0030D4CB00